LQICLSIPHVYRLAVHAAWILIPNFEPPDMKE